jgi:hypothetical protein
MVVALALLLIASGPAPFTLVNGTTAGLSDITARASGSRGAWTALGPGRLSAGARGAVPALGGETCVFDIAAQTEGGRVQWSDVNLCDVRAVTLNRRADGILWVDYD